MRPAPCSRQSRLYLACTVLLLRARSIPRSTPCSSSHAARACFRLAMSRCIAPTHRRLAWNRADLNRRGDDPCFSGSVCPRRQEPSEVVPPMRMRPPPEPTLFPLALRREERRRAYVWRTARPTLRHRPRPSPDLADSLRARDHAPSARSPLTTHERGRRGADQAGLRGMRHRTGYAAHALGRLGSRLTTGRPWSRHALKAATRRRCPRRASVATRVGSR